MTENPYNLMIGAHSFKAVREAFYVINLTPIRKFLITQTYSIVLTADIFLMSISEFLSVC